MKPQKKAGAHKIKEMTLDTTWNQLKPGIEEIYAPQKKNMDRKRYWQLYTIVYNYFIEGNDVTRRPKYRLNTKTADRRLALYDRLNQFLKIIVENLLKQGSSLRDEQLLQFYTTAWNDFKYSSKVLDGVCSYFNRFSSLKEMEGIFNDDCYGIYTLALVIWRDCWSNCFVTSLTTAVLRLIKKDRCGDIVNTSFISGVVNSYVELDNEVYHSLAKKSAVKNEDSKFKVYKESFEGKFLEETEHYYNEQSCQFLEQNPMPLYILKVEQWLQEEKRRFQVYQLGSVTSIPLKMRCEKVLIEKHLDSFYAVFKRLLNDHKVEELARLYRLVSPVNGVVEELKKEFQEWVLKKGEDAIDRCGEQAVTNGKLFVTTVFDIHKKYNSLVVTAFASDINLAKALDKACEKFVNSNAVTRRANTSTKAPELLAKYCDILLKKSTKNPEDIELEEALDQVMAVFKYIEDKDVFQKFYSKLFAKRLVNHTSVSDDSETSMIAKLKQACGFDYTIRLHRMLQDISLSKELSEQFRAHIQNSDSLRFDLTIQILSTGSWPFQKDSTNLSLPQELEKSVSLFTAYYHSKHSGRKLLWLYFLSKGDLMTNCFKNRYTFQVSTLQMAVLLQYNTFDKVTMQQLMDSTEIESEVLKEVLKPLLKSKLLLTEKSKSADCLRAESIVSLNTLYNNRKLRINLNVPMKELSKQEDERTLQHVDDDRKFVIEAAIVRIMKTRKTMKHQQLIGEVCNQLKSRFKPCIPAIKKCISTLIEKEYLERANNLADTYNYLA